jgi:hypothetical protein
MLPERVIREAVWKGAVIGVDGGKIWGKIKVFRLDFR